MLEKTIKSVGCIGILFFLCTTVVFAQRSECRREIRNGTEVIICDISESDPYPLGPVRVPNETKVLLRIVNKSPFDDCTLGEIKLTPIVEPDPIEKFLALFTKAATGVPVPGALNSTSGALTTLTDKLVNNSDNLARNLERVGTNTSDLLEDTYEPLVKDINTLISRKPSSSDEFTAYGGDAIRLRIERELDKDKNPASAADRELTTKYLEELINRSQAEYDLIREQVKGISNDPDAIDVLNNLAIAKGRLDALRTNYEAITTARGLFKQFVERTKPGTNPYIKEFPAFLPYTQTAASTSVTCTNAITKKVVYQQIPVAFNYKKDSRITVSAGPLFSTLPKQKLGTTQINTGLNSSGAPTFSSQFAVVDRASYQIIPFAFLNYRLMYLGESKKLTKPADFSLNLSFGIGVNPNSGTNEVEYFIGPSLGYKRFFFQFGDHIGRFQRGFTGGFNIGDTVPANFPSALPIDKEYKHRFGVAFSYRLF